MFLRKLSSNEKQAFLALASNLIDSDGVLSTDELIMLEDYKQEMNLPIDSACLLTTPESLEEFKCSSDTVRKQVIFELVALACADKDYNSSEYDLLVDICEQLDVRNDFLNKCKVLVEKLFTLYNEISRLMEK